MYSKSKLVVFVEVVGSTLVDVGVSLIGDEEGLRGHAKSDVNHCQKTVDRCSIQKLTLYYFFIGAGRI